MKPGRVDPGLVGMPDIYRTVLAVGGAKLPDLKLDGYDITGFLSGEEKESPRNEYFYILRDKIEAVRSENWKLRLASGEPELFDLISDPSERINRAEDMPEKVSELRLLMDRMSEETGTKVSGG